MTALPLRSGSSGSSGGLMSNSDPGGEERDIPADTFCTKVCTYLQTDYQYWSSYGSGLFANDSLLGENNGNTGGNATDKESANHLSTSQQKLKLKLDSIDGNKGVNFGYHFGDVIDPHELCDICNSRVKTHVCLPCKHAACMVCWNTFFESSTALNKPKKCFVCQQPSAGLQRYPLDLVPLQPYESNLNKLGNNLKDEDSSSSSIFSSFRRRVFKNLAELNVNNNFKEKTDQFLDVELEEKFEMLLHALLKVKDVMLLEVVSKLNSILLHLTHLNLGSMNANLRRPDIEAIYSVLAVEGQNLTETFHSYAKIFVSGSETGSQTLWSTLQVSLKEYDVVIDKVKKYYDNTPEFRRDNTMLKNAMETMRLCLSPRSLQFQWKSVKDLLYVASLEDPSVVPPLLSLFKQSRVFDETFCIGVLQIAKDKGDKLEVGFSELLENKLPILFATVDSGLVDTSDSKSLMVA